ncbi:glutathione S-transferase 1: isoform D-like protein [Leptotrombidium deliense]|uniref:Glutathione S-transferase 1: isoform D-like protein n=1 Tax=Leptotrombidium deliense TaxID=299467 RepID=A0A443SSE6_9ACAR|nr:glutathione S-transferase 1: isoform D-like protein [Leptotrombidium deliense]
MTIDLYYIPDSPNCRPVLMTAKHLKVPLNLKIVKLWEGEHMKPEYEKLNPQKCVPTLVDDGFVLGESRAIISYLANKYAPDSDIYPKCPKQRAVVDRMLYFDIGSLMKSIWDWIAPQGFEKKPPNADLEKAFVKHLNILNDRFLKEHKYVAGDHLTIADFAILSSVTTLFSLDYDLSKYANITSWLDRLEKQLPFWKEHVTEPVHEFKNWIKSNA